MPGEGGRESLPDPCARCMPSRNDTESSLRSVLGIFWREGDNPGDPYTVYMGYTQQGCEESSSYSHPLLESVQRSPEVAGAAGNASHRLARGHPSERLLWTLADRKVRGKICLGLHRSLLSLGRVGSSISSARKRSDGVSRRCRDPTARSAEGVLSDNGPEFIAEALRNLCKSIGAGKIYSSPYYPQGNSVCESFMRTLKKALSALASEYGYGWDVHLQAVAFAHNATPHTSTNHSPFFLVHGRGGSPDSKAPGYTTAGRSAEGLACYTVGLTGTRVPRLRARD